MLAHATDLAEKTITQGDAQAQASLGRNYIRMTELQEKYGVIVNGAKKLLFASNGTNGHEVDSELKQLEDLKKQIATREAELKKKGG
jgi:hypothetical protein